LAAAVVGDDFAPALHQQGAGATGRIADGVTRLGFEQLGNQIGDFRRGIELTGLLTIRWRRSS